MFLLLSVVVGLLAQFVDSVLGMAFGITSTSFLVLVGATPLVASASVHTAELGTTLVSGVAHWRAGNVDWKVLCRLALPGALGAWAGAHLLAGASVSSARPLVSVIMLLLGVVLMVRFGFSCRSVGSRRISHRVMPPLGLVAGFVDAAGGGGWGPVATPSLLAMEAGEPRKVVGTVSAAEFLVSASAVTGFLSAAAFAGVDWRAVAGLLAGGALVAPFAARLAAAADPRRFGVLVAGGVLVLNGDQLLRTLDAHIAFRLLWVLGVVAVVVLGRSRQRHLPVCPA